MPVVIPADQPINPANGRPLYCPTHPMPKGASGRWAHTNVEEVGDQMDGYPGGDLQRMRCKDCGVEWTTELPQ